MKTVYFLALASSVALIACIGDDPVGGYYGPQDDGPSQRVQVAPNDNPKDDPAVDSSDADVQVDAGADAAESPDAPPVVVEPTPDAGPDAEVPVDPTPDAGQDSGPTAFDSNVTVCDINRAYTGADACQLDAVPSWKDPHMPADRCTESDVQAFWEAAFGALASEAGMTSFRLDHPACNSCILSRTVDAAWGPVVRTPNNHYAVNSGGCRKTQTTNPIAGRFPTYEWKFEQCVTEQCDGETSQENFLACRQAVKIGACSIARVNASLVDSRMGEFAPSEYSAIASCGTTVYGPNTGGGEDLKSRFVASATVMCGL